MLVVDVLMALGYLAVLLTVMVFATRTHETDRWYDYVTVLEPEPQQTEESNKADS